MRDGILQERSFAFAKRIVILTRKLQSQKKEFVLSKQLLRSGTSIGALVRESVYAQSTADFINKLSIALKEAHETEYWIQLLIETDTIDKEEASISLEECKSLIRILVASIKTLKGV